MTDNNTFNGWIIDDQKTDDRVLLFHKWFPDRDGPDIMISIHYIKNSYEIRCSAAHRMHETVLTHEGWRDTLDEAIQRAKSICDEWDTDLNP